MKVLVTTKTLAKGGAEVLISSIIPKLIANGCIVHVLYYQKCDCELIDKISNSGATVSYIGRYNLMELLTTLYRTYVYINNFEPDIIFEHSPLVSTFTRLLPVKASIVYLEHSVFNNYNIITKYLNKFTYSLVDQVIFCSESVALSHGGSGLVMNNAIDLESVVSFSPEISFPDYKVVISVANISKVKNHQMLIDAFERMETSNVKLILVGAPRDNNDYVKLLISNSPKKNDIILYGPSSNVISLLASSDVFCLTSIHEGLPLSLLEAMSVGTVPICTDVGGIPEVIGNDCGYIVRVGDVQDLSSKLDYMLSNQFVYDKFSSCAKEKISRDYDLNNYVVSLLKVFTRLSKKT